MKTPTRIIVAAVILCLALISVSCSSDGYSGTSRVYVGVGYGGYGPGWGHGWGGYGGYYPPPVVIAPPPIPNIPDMPVAEPF
jgi:hypothetical protein